MFTDRIHAASRIASALHPYKGLNPLVLGIPKGGAIMARHIADALQGDLDVVLAHKLRHPQEPEVAIGAVDEEGLTYMNVDMSSQHIPQSYIDKEAKRQLDIIHARRRMYTPVKPEEEVKGRVLIVVDDGLATGATMVAALRSLRGSHPSKLVAATAVAPASTLELIRPLADEVVCLEVPDDFQAVGQYFDDFSDVSDEDVIAVLQRGA